MAKMPVPKAVEENGWDFWRESNDRLWALDIPVEEVPMKVFEWIFDLPFWEDDEGNFTITPREFMRMPSKYPAHQKRIATADTSYPADIMKNKKGRWMILDGLHRIIRLKMDGQATVRVRRVPRSMIAAIRTD